MAFAIVSVQYVTFDNLRPIESKYTRRDTPGIVSSRFLLLNLQGSGQNKPLFAIMYEEQDPNDTYLI